MQVDDGANKRRDVVPCYVMLCFVMQVDGGANERRDVVSCFVIIIKMLCDAGGWWSE